VAVIRSRKSKKVPVRKKAVTWLGVDAQSWRCREEDPHTPFSSLPQYPALPMMLTQVSVFVVGDDILCVEDRIAQVTKYMVLRALLAQEWQEPRGLLVVAARSPSVYHGGSRLKRKWRHARKLRRLWGHVPAMLWRYICGMSDPEREPGSEPVDDVETFTQSSPAVVLGAATLEEVAAADVIVRCG
jgi:hypothetical protein